jgi:glycine cleavage system H protein
MPVSGEILEFNSKLSAEGDDEPDLVNAEPYGAGWIVKIKLSKPEELDDLMGAEAYSEEIS